MLLVHNGFINLYPTHNSFNTNMQLLTPYRKLKKISPCFRFSIFQHTIVLRFTIWEWIDINSISWYWNEWRTYEHIEKKNHIWKMQTIHQTIYQTICDFIIFHNWFWCAIGMHFISSELKLLQISSEWNRMKNRRSCEKKGWTPAIWILKGNKTTNVKMVRIEHVLFSLFSLNKGVRLDFDAPHFTYSCINNNISYVWCVYHIH